MKQIPWEPEVHEGWQAREAGLALADNPHRGTNRAYRWEFGWRWHETYSSEAAVRRRALARETAGPDAAARSEGRSDAREGG